MTVGTVVCRSKSSCGSTQTDSSMMEKAQTIYARCEPLAVYCSNMIRTSMNLMSVPLNIKLTKGAETRAPPKQILPSLHDFSRSLVRGKTRSITRMM